MADPTRIDEERKVEREAEQAESDRLDALSLCVADGVLCKPECDEWHLQSVGRDRPLFYKINPCGHDENAGSEEAGTYCRPAGLTPSYAKRLDACEEVLGWLEQRGCDYEIHARGGDTYWLILTWLGERGDIKSVRGTDCPTMPEAICQAALALLLKETL